MSIQSCCFTEDNCVFDKEWIYNKYVKCLCNTSIKNENYLLDCQSLEKSDDMNNKTHTDNLRNLYVFILCLALLLGSFSLYCIFFFHKNRTATIIHIDFDFDDNPAEEEPINDH